MSQTIPATCVLGPGKTGLTIGLRVLNLDGTEYAAFSATGVAETSVAGTYRKAGGVVCPDAGAYIVWGVSGTDYAEATVESTAVNVTHHAGVAVAAADANGNVPVNIKAVNSSLAAADGLTALSEWYDAKTYVTVLGQDIRDAMKLAPTAGAAAAGSVDAHLDALALEATAQAILEDTGTTLPALLTSTLASFVNTYSTDATTAGSITRRRGDSWTIVPAALGVLTGYTSLWLTIKRSHDDADSASVLHVKKNASGLLDGLLYLNGAASTPNLASITVTDALTGVISIAVEEAATKELAPGEYYYDVQALIGGNVSTPDSGTFTVTADTTRSVE